MRTRSRVKPMQLAITCLGIAALALCGAASYAQAPGGGPGGQGLSPEVQAQAWALQAKAVAKELALADDVTPKLVDAYKAARESQMTALRAKMTEGGGQGGLGNWEALREITKAERGKLETALKGFLKEDQTAKALGTLGTFNRRWDAMTMVLDGLKLDEAKGAEATKLVMAYVMDSDKIMQDAFAAGATDRTAARDKSRALKQKLDENLGKVLSAEQLKTWTEATTMRGGGGGRRGDGPGTPLPGVPPAPK